MPDPCPACGHANTADSGYCSSCGAAIAEAGGDSPTADLAAGDAQTAGRAAAGVQSPQGSEGESPQGSEGESAQGSEGESPQGSGSPGPAAFGSDEGLFVVRQGPKAGARYALDDDLVTLGRHPRSTIFLDDITVSRRHAEVHRSQAAYRVRDVGSLNGTYVNRKRVEEAALTDGDEIQIGRFKLVFMHGTGP